MGGAGFWIYGRGEKDGRKGGRRGSLGSMNKEVLRKQGWVEKERAMGASMRVGSMGGREGWVMGASMRVGSMRVGSMEV